MPIEIRMPRPAPEIEEADLIAWLVEPGAEIALGDPILEIETEKSTLEIESPCAGQLQEILVPPGSLSVPVGTLLGLAASKRTDPLRFRRAAWVALGMLGIALFASAFP